MEGSRSAEWDGCARDSLLSTYTRQVQGRQWPQHVGSAPSYRHQENKSSRRRRSYSARHRHIQRSALPHRLQLHPSLRHARHICVAPKLGSDRAQLLTEIRGTTMLDQDGRLYSVERWVVRVVLLRQETSLRQQGELYMAQLDNYWLVLEPDSYMKA
ncbi:hypothetical protein K439DRAFT_313369 [Ramaria rubella]|nr:hypothetical protein K439DRAFT_313369 [Ramaria rubella]